MTPLEPRDPDFEQRVRCSFAQQGLMETFGSELATVDPGVVEILVPFSSRLTQQDGFLHAGVVIAAADSACGYAALTLMENDRRVLTVELKVNLLAAASGDRLIARGEVLRADRRSRSAAATLTSSLATRPTRSRPS